MLSEIPSILSEAVKLRELELHDVSWRTFQEVPIDWGLNTQPFPRLTRLNLNFEKEQVEWSTQKYRYHASAADVLWLMLRSTTLLRTPELTFEQNRNYCSETYEPEPAENSLPLARILRDITFRKLRCLNGIMVSPRWMLEVLLRHVSSLHDLTIGDFCSTEEDEDAVHDLIDVMRD